ncbi:UNVERIFIED_CONTAM: putative mitochondrial protein [Sesamum radiatum]|uniref:Mitochondrial protein n=1 Tax=Sesamum radiatum TaxID=300843 RepID=A0AAW2VKW7_SESRA
MHEQRLNRELDSILQSEETFWKQRGKNHWLKEGDRNTSFFHNQASRTFRRNSISRLKDSDGNWTEEDSDIENHIIHHFNRVFNSEDPSDNDLERGLEAMTRKVDSDMNSELLKPYSAEEIIEAISHMAPLKSPGPDGMPPIFFHKFWHIIKNDVINYVLAILNDHSLEPSLNFTHIVLIPKCNKPDTISQFRPISLCNVVMKIATKCIANRLKPLLDRIIAPTQSAFIPGRLISDNILIAFEINHFLKNKTWGNTGHMAIKLDISKAYDKVEWSFLRQVLLKLGFHSLFVDLVLLCVSFVSYSIILGGRQFGNITPRRGLRQGDLLSPYLFLLCTDALTSLISKAEAKGDIRGIQICREAPSISHLLFADDTLICCQATIEAMQCVNSILQAGKEILIKAVLQAIPTYAMGVFCLPDGLIQDIEGMIARFWWNSGDRHKIHWLKWNKLTTPKMLGGLGLRDLRAFNTAMLAKQLWRLLIYPESLVGRLLKARYYPDSSILDAELGSRPSFTWRSVISAKPIIMAGHRWRIGDGHTIRIWIDPWIPGNPSFRPSLRLEPLPPPTTVDQLFVSEGGDWNVPLIESTFPPHDAQAILSIPIGRTGFQDDIIWHHTKSGSFSVKSAYHLVCNIAHMANPSSSYNNSTSSRAGWMVFGMQRFLTRLRSSCGAYAMMPFQLAPMSVIGFLPPKFAVHSAILKKKLAVTHSYSIPLAHLILTTSVSSSWRPPEQGFVKINYDVALFFDTGDFGIGIIARDHNGNCLAWLSQRLHRIISPEIGEAWVARAAVELGCRSNWDKIVIEGDCANLVKQLVTHEGHDSSTEVIIRDIFALCPRFRSSSFSLVRRQGNCVAHSIARSAINFAEGHAALPPHYNEHLLADMPSL